MTGTARCVMTLQGHSGSMIFVSSERAYALPVRVFNSPEFSGRHDFQAKKMWTSVYKIWKSCSKLRPTRKIKQKLNENKTYYLRH